MICVTLCVCPTGDDADGADVRGGRSGGQPGVRPPLLALQLHSGQRHHPDLCEHGAERAHPDARHLPAAGQ